MNMLNSSKFKILFFLDESFMHCRKNKDMSCFIPEDLQCVMNLSCKPCIM